MLKSLFDSIRQYKDVQLLEVGGKTYSNESLKRINPDAQDGPSPIIVHTLSGLSKFLNMDGFCESKDILANNDEPFFHIMDFDRVQLVGRAIPKNDNRRFTYAEARLRNDSFEFGHWLELEDFIIAMQSQFIRNDDIDNMINHLGNLANENVIENKDDGFSQTIQVRSGITTKSKVKILNPMVLIPYRTFREIDQPASNCVFRLRKNENNGRLIAALFEAGGDQWKSDSIEGIYNYLSVHAGGVPIVG